MNRLRTWLAAVSLPDAAPPWSFTTPLFTLAFAIAAMLVGVTVALVWTGDVDITQIAGLTFGGILIIAFIWQTRREREALRLATSPTPLLFTMFVSFGCALALDLLGLALTREFLPTPELLRLNPNTLGAVQWIFAAVFMVIVQPLAEGLVFRGIVQPSVRTLLSGWGSVLVTAAISGAYHYMLYPPNYNTDSSLAPLWYGLIAPIIAAVLFGAVRASSKSTRAAIAAQIAFGLFAIVKLLTLTGAG